MHRVLGAYLIVVASIQSLLYVASLTNADSSLFYFDSRIGLFFLETMLRQREVYPGLLSWVSVGVLAALGVQVLQNPARVRWYLLVEPAMATPTILTAIVVAAANLSPAHGFSADELIVPLAVLVIATVVPYGLAWKLRSMLANMPLQPTNGAGLGG